jgi:hypothetical protein
MVVDEPGDDVAVLAVRFHNAPHTYVPQTTLPEASWPQLYRRSVQAPRTQHSDGLAE